MLGLQAQCDSLLQHEKSQTEEASELERQLVAQAIEFERRRERFRRELHAVREKNRTLEKNLVDLERYVHGLLETSVSTLTTVSQHSPYYSHIP